MELAIRIVGTATLVIIGALIVWLLFWALVYGVLYHAVSLLVLDWHKLPQAAKKHPRWALRFCVWVAFGWMQKALWRLGGHASVTQVNIHPWHYRPPFSIWRDAPPQPDRIGPSDRVGRETTETDHE